MSQLGILRLYKITQSLLDFIKTDYELKTNLVGVVTHTVVNDVGVKKKDTLTLTGIQGSITVTDTNGTKYLLEFDTDLNQSVLNFKNDYEATWLSQGVVLTNNLNTLVFESSIAGVDFTSPITSNLVEESFLYRCIDSDDVIEEISYRELAEELFTRDSMNSRKASVELMFSADKAMLPQIAIREPAKNKGQTDGIGGIGDEIYLNEDGSFNEERRKSFTSQFELLITSPNRHEVIIMEEVLLGLFIGAQDTLALANPFYSFNFTIKELMINNQTYAEQLFVKSIGINTSYDRSYPNLSDNSVLTKILFEHQILS